jgi:hypothetical protein
MLVRVSSGASGIVSYLETGRKKGREFDRDLIDERITLDGDLNVIDAIIDSTKTAQEGDAKYLHITLGFSEDFTTLDNCLDSEVNLRKMQEVTNAYKAMLMTAYDPSEYAFYAEAHIPKVSHEINESTGQYEKRLPHIHIVIPMRNLESGRYLNPFGFGKDTLQYAEAMQESINTEFKLRSPKNAVRDESESSLKLQKHNDKFKEKSPVQIKKIIKTMVENGEIASFDDLVKTAEQFGDVKIRQGSDGDYINVKPTWADKGINLKDWKLDSFLKAGGEGVKAATVTLKKYDDVVHHWKERAALEARYVTSGNKKIYKALDEAGKLELLRKKIAETTLRLTPQEATNERPNYTEINIERQSNIELAAALCQSDTANARRRKPPETIASVRNLSSVPMVHKRRSAEMLLQQNALDSLGASRAAHNEVRRTGNGNTGTGIEASERVGRITLSVVDTLKKMEVPGTISADKLKSETSPSVVLSDAARRFGIKIDDYSISSAKDGTPRIRHSDKHYNLGDFYTKHIGITWAEALPILKDCYNTTLSNGLPAPDKELWKSFGVWRNADALNSKIEKDLIRKGLRSQIVSVRNSYKALKINSGKKSTKERQSILAKGRAEQLIKLEEIRVLEKEAIEKAKRPSRNTQYRMFLNNLASDGNLHALGELRRMAQPDTIASETITGDKSKTVLPLPSYKIDHNGKVTYFSNEKALVSDSIKGITVLDSESNSYAIALKVAVARYGKELTFNGDELFMKNMIAAAKKSGLDLVIKNADKPREAPIIIAKIVKPMAR